MLKTYAKKLVTWYLALLSRHFLNKKKPFIIGVTGSYGKTSTKDAIAHLLSRSILRQAQDDISQEFPKKIYASKKSLNTEFGFALAVLDLSSGYSNPFRWFWVLIRATFRAILTTCQYEIMVLEYGADKPGDIEYLISIVKPDIGILTAVAPVHLEKGQFASVEAIFEEKKKLLTCLEKNDLAIFPGDYPLFQNLKNEVKAKIKTFGKNPSNTIAVESITSTLDGITGMLRYRNASHLFHFPVLGKHHIFIFLVALLAGEIRDIPIEEGIECLKSFSLPPGRFSKIPGENGSILLDSSYNASPETTEAALKLLSELPAKRKIAVLGSMNELGKESERHHRNIGRLIPKMCHYVITVGKDARWISEEASKEGMPKEMIEAYETAEEAGERLRSLAQEGDIILFKGSQNQVRLEKAVKKVMMNPSMAPSMLPRQEREWIL